VSPPSGRDRSGDIRLEVEIEAPVETVWKALSEAEELRRWFPLNARVEPGKGGSIWLSWGPGVEGEAPIEVWDENRHLRWVERDPGDPSSVPVAVDFTIEARGGNAVVRLVQSGFSADADWSEYLDTLDSGWKYFLRNLKHYLEHHRGTPRRMVWSRRKMDRSRHQVWRAVTGSDGLMAVEGPVAVGAGFQLWSGPSGIIDQVTDGVHLAGGIPDLNDGLILIELEPGAPSFHLGVWLSTYGLDEGGVAHLQTTLDEAMDGL
jgi:uncharacterized protein YndB with AHSA1/START domain